MTQKEIERCKNNLLMNGIDDKGRIDWRAPENREALFEKYYEWRILSHDLDHVHYMNHLCADYNYEQRAWFAFCFGMTYRTPQSFAYTETFENINLVTEKWHDENWRRTTYGTDARYNKGHFFSQVQSIRAWLGGKTFEEKLNGIIVHDNQRQNFWALYKEILGLYKFGRMTGWLTLQALHDLLQLPIDPEDIMLEGFSPNNDSSLQSIWNGLCVYTNQVDKFTGGKYGDYTCNQKDVEWAREALLEHTESAERKMGIKIDSFRRESIWCQYKRLFNRKNSKEYAGHASGDAVSRYLYYREHWPEIDWSKFRKSIRAQPGTLKGMTQVSWFDYVFGETGYLLNLHEIDGSMFANAYEELGINHHAHRVAEVWTDDGLEVPETFDFREDLKTTDQWYTKR